MTRRGQTLLKGHALVGEGQPFNDAGRAVGYGWTGGEGRAKCECGALSPVLSSGRARQAWHADHKQAVREGRT